VLTSSGYEVLDLNARRVRKGVSRIDWDLDQIEKGGYDHFMIKEIMEQPQTIQNTMRGRLVVDEGFSKLGGLNLTREELLNIDHIVITACGTSWHSGLIGEMMIEEHARIPTETEYASEFRYRNPIVTPRTLCVVISQSGETADTLAAAREAKEKGAHVVSIVNVVGSTLARESDGAFFTHCGPEISVASTKAFTAQLTALYMLALHLGRVRGTLSAEHGKAWLDRLVRLPSLVERVLGREAEIVAIAKRFYKKRNFLFFGRGINYPIALEGALKLKEVSYIHAEGYAAGEMKHGPIALINRDMPVVVLAPRDRLYEKTVSNLMEVKARHAPVIAFVAEGERELGKIAEAVFTIPDTHPLISPILFTIPLQLLAYHIAVLRGADVDQPRNLAKSVTVE
jgi:glutamine---fructose-6-phosphate transaminase (isomerizing)